ncbi:hypothetical protein CO082_01740 [Candidatus Peregrinibacteria bacterium CG_4_9_14_0_8_um_filter_44_15]|nr:MAG: hypothetical protein CO082_01740 [Candidatus Peregrinibacteria bacterium CG_4_9_14_0_8_um_filter_44_15]
MKKVPVENQEEIDITFNIMPLSGSFIARSIMSSVEKINQLLSKGKYWDNLRILDSLIHSLREMTSKLERRKAELLKRDR